MCVFAQTQLLAERQTAMYSLQRKLKTCRQTLDSKELHLGLVQKKVTVLEERILSYSKKEGEWENSIDKVSALCCVSVKLLISIVDVVNRMYKMLHKSLYIDSAVFYLIRESDIIYLQR